jgi:hypothetical protein
MKGYMFPYAHDKEDKAIIRLIMDDECLNCYYMTPTVLVFELLLEDTSNSYV